VPGRGGSGPSRKIDQLPSRISRVRAKELARVLDLARHLQRDGLRALSPRRVCLVDAIAAYLADAAQRRGAGLLRDATLTTQTRQLASFSTSF
jgi:hypothetical protein